MNDSDVTLVTTDLEDTLPLDGKVLFLGEWCKPYFRENQSTLDHETIPYHWNNRQKLANDFNLLQEIRSSVLKDLSLCLNKLHGVNHSEQYWDLLLGYWLNSFIAIAIDRYSSIEQAASYCNNFKTFVFEVQNEFLASSNSVEFIKLSSENSLWNHAFFAMAIREIGGCRVSKLDAKKTQDIGLIPISKFSFVKTYLKSKVGFAIAYIKRNDKYFLTSTYLPFWRLLKLEISLRQLPLPRFYKTNKDNFIYSKKLRDWSLPILREQSEIEKFSRKYLPLFIPRIFIEGYQDLKNADKSNLYPKANVIFTSNQHFSDDFFKSFVANKMELGSRLVVGEHGGLGVGLFNGAHQYELGISNCYLTTGWSNPKVQQLVPIGNFRSSVAAVRSSMDGNALLVCGNMPRYATDIRAMALSSQTLDYFSDQFTFVDCLPQYIRSHLLVRLYSEDYGWDQLPRWQERFASINLDNGRAPIWRVAKQCRIFIATYNATTYIEAFSKNFPTIMFWDPRSWEVKPEAKTYFDELEMAGIFHATPESAAKHLSSIWPDISGWWFSDKVQNARVKFCNTYAREEVNCVNLIKKVLIRECSKVSQ